MADKQPVAAADDNPTGGGGMAAGETDCDQPAERIPQETSPKRKTRGIRPFIIIGGTVALIAFLPGFGEAFHSGGVGYCDGCHSLHSAAAPSPVEDSGAPAGSGGLLAGKDASSTCLRCHAEAGAGHNVLSQDGSSYTPGGDFAWLKKSFQWTEDGKANQSPGESHGHSVVAAEYGLSSDGRLSTAPGGTYPSAALGCISCHDPHGKISGGVSGGGPVGVSGSYGESPPGNTVAGNYRLLGGAGYDGGGSGIAFTQPAPVAVANPGNWKETEATHPAYGSGMSEWCGNCHAGMVSGGSGTGKSHPAGNDMKLGREIAESYNAYVKTGDMSGSKATAYLALVPFERGTADRSLLDPSSTEGPDGNSNVMCLTCHRAHASAFPGIGRWDFRATFLAKSHPQAGDAGAAGNDKRDSYYGRDVAAQFGPYQRSFCNKCHPRD